MYATNQLVHTGSCWTGSKQTLHLTFIGDNLLLFFRSSEFIIRMSRDTLSILKRHLQEKKHSVVLNIIQEHLYFDMYEGVARNKQQIEATAGAVVGEATRQGEWSGGLIDGSKHCVCAN